MFPENLNVSRGRAKENIEIRGKQNELFPEGPVICYIAIIFEAGHSLLKPCCNGGRQSTFAGNSALLPSHVLDFAILHAQRFWRETISFLDFM